MADRHCFASVDTDLPVCFFAVLGANCRFQPTCSQYAYEAVVSHGAVRGAWLAIRRVGRCHPWGDAGYDPVPQQKPDAQQG